MTSWETMNDHRWRTWHAHILRHALENVNDDQYLPTSTFDQSMTFRWSLNVSDMGHRMAIGFLPLDIFFGKQILVANSFATFQKKSFDVFFWFEQIMPFSFPSNTYLRATVLDNFQAVGLLGCWAAGLLGEKCKCYLCAMPCGKSSEIVEYKKRELECIAHTMHALENQFNISIP